MCGDCVDGCLGSLLFCCCLYCYNREGKLPAMYTADQTEAPRPVKRPSQRPSKRHKNRFASVKILSQQRFPVRQAHENLIAHLAGHPTDEQAAAHSRLRSAFQIPRDQLSPEALAPVIKDLDTLLFVNTLGERIIIEWADMAASRRRMLRGISLPYDISRSGISKVRIRLNRAMFSVDGKEDVWGTIVHEMLHAYLDLTSTWSGLTKPHHGALFERSCWAVVDRLALEGLRGENVV